MFRAVFGGAEPSQQQRTQPQQQPAPYQGQQQVQYQPQQQQQQQQQQSYQQHPSSYSSSGAAVNPLSRQPPQQLQQHQQQQQQQQQQQHQPQQQNRPPQPTALQQAAQQRAASRQDAAQFEGQDAAAARAMAGHPLPPSPSDAAAAAAGAALPSQQSFPELASLSAEELRILLTDPAAYRRFLHNMPQVKQMEEVIKELEQSNLELAKSTLALEPEVQELQTQCRIIRGTELAAAQERLQSLIAQQQDVYAQCGPSALIAKLQEAAREAERESEALQQKFLEGGMGTADFLREYKAKRELYHLRHQTELAALATLTIGRSA